MTLIVASVSHALDVIATIADDTTEGGYIVSSTGIVNSDGTARTVGTSMSGDFWDTVYTFKLPDLGGRVFQSAEFNFTVVDGFGEQGFAPTADLVGLRISPSNEVTVFDHQEAGTLFVDSILTAAGNDQGDFVTTGTNVAALNNWIGSNYVANAYAVIALQAKSNPLGSRNRWLIADDAGNVRPATLAINSTPGTCSPGDTDGDGDIDTGDLTTAITNFTGAGGSGKTCADGDTDDDGDVDTGDLTFSITNFTGAQAGNAGVPDLVYDPATGNVTIDADGADVISFSLQSGPFNAADFSELPAGLTDNIAKQIGWTSFNLFSGLTGTANLGAILPAGLDLAGLEAALTTASYGLALAGGGGGGRLDIVIPEPASMVLMGLGVIVLARRRCAL